jgi:hypothetical protein
MGRRAVLAERAALIARMTELASSPEQPEDADSGSPSKGRKRKAAGAGGED